MVFPFKPPFRSKIFQPCLTLEATTQDWYFDHFDQAFACKACRESSSPAPSVRILEIHRSVWFNQHSIKKVHLSRAKNLSPLPCRLDMLTLGLAHCLRAHSVILCENNEKKLAYADLTHWEISKKWCLTTGFAYATACFHRQICATRQRGNVLRKFQKQFQRRGFFGAIAGPKRLLFARACGLLLKKSSSAYALLTRSLRGAYAECGHSVGEL